MDSINGTYLGDIYKVFPKLVNISLVLSYTLLPRPEHPHTPNTKLQRPIKSPTNEIYTGEIASNKDRSGFGLLLIDSETLFEGFFSNNSISGQGRLYKPSFIFEGEFQGLSLSRGKVYNLKDKTVFEGEIFQLKPHGKGKLHQKGHWEFSGKFKEGLRDGIGTLIWTNQDRYEGNFVRDKEQGYGELKKSDGTVYHGEWSIGKMHGKGKLIIPNDYTYEGMFSHGQRQGHGTCKWVSGKEYEGFWMKDKYDGFGKEIKNGEVCEGIWRNGVFKLNQSTSSRNSSGGNSPRTEGLDSGSDLLDGRFVRVSKEGNFAKRAEDSFKSQRPVKLADIIKDVKLDLQIEKEEKEEQKEFNMDLSEIFERKDVKEREKSRDFVDDLEENEPAIKDFVLSKNSELQQSDEEVKEDERKVEKLENDVEWRLKGIEKEKKWDREEKDFSGSEKGDEQEKKGFRDTPRFDIVDEQEKEGRVRDTPRFDKLDEKEKDLRVRDTPRFEINEPSKSESHASNPEPLNQSFMSNSSKAPKSNQNLSVSQVKVAVGSKTVKIVIKKPQIVPLLEIRSRIHEDPLFQISYKKFKSLNVFEYDPSDLPEVFLTPDWIHLNKEKAYKGFVNVSGLPEGNGVMLQQGRIYQGGFLNGKKHGMGRLITPLGRVYEGFWKKGKKHGFGAFSSESEQYCGDWALGLYHGLGVLTKNEGVYDGEFIFGVCEGKAVLYFPDGKTFEGDFKNGVPHGFGNMRFGSTLEYDHWKEGVPKTHEILSMQKLTPVIVPQMPQESEHESPDSSAESSVDIPQEND